MAILLCVAVMRPPCPISCVQTRFRPVEALSAAGLPNEQAWRLSVQLDDGTSRHMEELGDEVLKTWCDVSFNAAVSEQPGTRAFVLVPGAGVEPT